MQTPDGFESPATGVVVREGHADQWDEWVRALGRPGTDAPREGRGGARRVALADGGHAFVRPLRHGGLLRALFRDVYWNRPPRPLVELRVTEEARRRGVLVPEVLGVGVMPLGSGPPLSWLYRGVVVTRELERMRSLAVALKASADVDRHFWLRAVGQAVEHLHEQGIEHVDLNVGNILVGRIAEEPIGFVDFDRGRVCGAPVSTLGRLSARRRIVRSVSKLGLRGLHASRIRRSLRGEE